MFIKHQVMLNIINYIRQFNLFKSHFFFLISLINTTSFTSLTIAPVAAIAVAVTTDKPGSSGIACWLSGLSSPNYSVIFTAMWNQSKVIFSETSFNLDRLDSRERSFFQQVRHRECQFYSCASFVDFRWLSFRTGCYPGLHLTGLKF